MFFEPADLSLGAVATVRGAGTLVQPVGITGSGGKQVLSARLEGSQLPITLGPVPMAPPVPFEPPTPVPVPVVDAPVIDPGADPGVAPGPPPGPPRLLAPPVLATLPVVLPELGAPEPPVLAAAALVDEPAVPGAPTEPAEAGPLEMEPTHAVMERSARPPRIPRREGPFDDPTTTDEAGLEITRLRCPPPPTKVQRRR